MSPRFVSDVELGRGNISIGRLNDIASALEVPLSTLLGSAGAETRDAINTLLGECDEHQRARVLILLQIALNRRVPQVVALLGIRGAGKSTVGVALARELELPFVELARKIEEAAGMSIGDVLTLHGESFYRTLELRCLKDLVASGIPCVAALPGGVVSHPEAFRLVLETCSSVWLRARPEDYWDRVFAQGDTRPMAGIENAMAHLVALVEERRPAYEQADLVVDTSDVPADQVVEAVLESLDGIRTLR
jgi:XRE family aerobic/anaerobic benzoate catabolism transcriptional regulator